MKLQFRPRGQRGFTLLELLVVLVVLGLLAGIVAPKYFAQLGRSEVKVAKAQIEGLSKALDIYRLEVGHYPSTEQGLQALVTAPSDEAKWTGPYLQKKLPQDPWGVITPTATPAKTASTTCCRWARTASPAAKAKTLK
jgi:general secretion pathway protein G